MAIRGLNKFLEQRGSEHQWEKKAEEAEKEASAKEAKRSTKRKKKKVETKEEKEARVAEWISKNRDETKEWHVTFTTERERVEWIEKRRVHLGLDPIDASVIDMGLLYPSLIKIRSKLYNAYRLGRLDAFKVNQIYTFGHLQLCNVTIQQHKEHFGSHSRLLAAFDHHDQRDQEKERTAKARAEVEMKKRAVGIQVKESKKLYDENQQRRRNHRRERIAKKNGEEEKIGMIIEEEIADGLGDQKEVDQDSNHAEDQVMSGEEGNEGNPELGKVVERVELFPVPSQNAN